MQKLKETHAPLHTGSLVTLDIPTDKLLVVIQGPMWRTWTDVEQDKHATLINATFDLLKRTTLTQRERLRRQELVKRFIITMQLAMGSSMACKALSALDAMVVLDMSSNMVPGIQQLMRGSHKAFATHQAMILQVFVRDYLVAVGASKNNLETALNVLGLSEPAKDVMRGLLTGYITVVQSRQRVH